MSGLVRATPLYPPSSPPHPHPLALSQEGFSSWNRRDFSAFVRACEKYGRDRLDQIAGDMDSKTQDEVRGALLYWEGGVWGAKGEGETNGCL